MLGLPSSTDIQKQLPKKAIYAKFQMNTKEKAQIDADIAKIVLVNEVASRSLQIADGTETKVFYVLQVVLKTKNFNNKNIITLSKLIPQKMLMVLEYGDEAKLAVFHSNKLIQTDWQPKDRLCIELRGLNLDKVWEDIIVQVGDITLEQGNTLDEQIKVNEATEKLKNEIAKLEKRARAEKQPKKKFELVKQINVLKKEFENG